MSCLPVGKQAVAGLTGQSLANSQPSYFVCKTGLMCELQDSPAVSGEINGVQCCITVDTGSNICIV